jgi:hypothetical protein
MLLSLLRNLTLQVTSSIPIWDSIGPGISKRNRYLQSIPLSGENAPALHIGKQMEIVQSYVEIHFACVNLDCKKREIRVYEIPYGNIVVQNNQLKVKPVCSL